MRNDPVDSFDPHIIDGLGLPQRQWIEEHTDAAPGKVVLTGPEGSGKTTLAAALHWKLAQRGRLCYWFDCYENEPEALLDVLRSPRSSAPVFVDDLGKEQERDIPTMVTVINSLSRKTRLVVVTTNLNITTDPDTCALAARYGRSARSRLLGNGSTIFMNGPDFRLV